MTDDLHDLAASYALDALDPDERAAFEAHHSTCESCQREVAEFRATAAELAGSTTSAPPAGLRDRVLADVSTSRQEPPVVGDRVVDLASERARRRPLLLAAVAAAALVAIIVGAGVFTFGDDDDAGTALASVLVEPDAELVALDGAWPGSVSVAWSERAGRYALLAEGLPGPGIGLTYELWLIADGAPVPAGLFVPEDGTSELIDDLPALPAVWAVTIEPEGGSPAPTGDIILSAEIVST